MSIEDREYYRIRAIKSREQAEMCVDVAARRAHSSLADRYQALADGAKVKLNVVERG